jgi:hypothetical protein
MRPTAESSRGREMRRMLGVLSSDAVAQKATDNRLVAGQSM